MTELERTKKAVRTSAIYLAVSIFVLVFGVVYTHFGHGVTSDNMSYAFLRPLFGGSSLYILIALFTKLPYPDFYSACLYAFGIAAFTIYTVINGILDIAGAYADSAIIMKISGIVLVSAGVILYITLAFIKKFKTSNATE